VQIRTAQLADAEAIVSVINAAFRVERFFLDRDRTSLSEVLTWLRTGTFLVACDAGLAGCVYIESRGERAYLGLLSVSPSRQNSGLGSQLMTAAEDRCLASGCRFVDLRIVNLREELPAFYRRRGYVETGAEPFPAEVPTKLPCHFVVMSKPLHRTLST